MRYWTFFLLLLLALSSCDDETVLDQDAFEDFECDGFVDSYISSCDWEGEFYTGEVFTNKGFNLVWLDDRDAYTLAGFKDSTTTVVNLWHSAGQCVDYSDDEWGQAVFFELPAGVTSFDFSDEELAALNCFHKESGAWISTLPAFITEGRVAGEKTNTKKWEIAIGVSLPDSTSRGNSCLEYRGDFIVR